MLVIHTDPNHHLKASRKSSRSVRVSPEPVILSRSLGKDEQSHEASSPHSFTPPLSPAPCFHTRSRVYLAVHCRKLLCQSVQLKLISARLQTLHRALVRDLPHCTSLIYSVARVVHMHTFDSPTVAQRRFLTAHAERAAELAATALCSAASSARRTELIKALAQPPDL